MPPSSTDQKPVLIEGQRWLSEAEPELGLGTILRVEDRSVILEFPAADEMRRYAVHSAPLRRVRFAPGDKIADCDGNPFVVERVEEVDGLLVYCQGEDFLPESSVSDRIGIGGARERLFAGRLDAPEKFDLRLETLRRLHSVRKSPVRGFIGPRIELLPHQFYIADEVTRRHAPRVLLADETGLGKTIEAGLIMARLLLSGRASRILVLVPESLVNQWLVELRRRFQLSFAVFDAERCKATEESDPDSNPFLDEQLVLAPISLLEGDAGRTAQAQEAGWDLVVVDEAHHLEWEPGSSSPAYDAVEAVAASAEGLVLLTATPEQLGEEAHFARLRLLDPDRYPDLEQWRAEAGEFRSVAKITAKLLDHEAGAETPLSKPETATLEKMLGYELAATAFDGGAGTRAIVSDLLDRHGPGRVMFRNTRAAVQGFPVRKLELHALAPSTPGFDGSAVLEEVLFDLSGEGPEPSWRLEDDERVKWLVDLLRGSEPEKLLVLCRTRAKAEALQRAIQRHLNIDLALFHEGLTLLQRDRNAAWFAQPDGARVLLCSEIGSEGRNFQQAHHLVMFDLPLDPDLVEQRIGRLDRIGQRSTVTIHVPFVAGSARETLVRWHHEGVHAFERPMLTSAPLLKEFAPALLSAIGAAPDAAGDDCSGAATVHALIEATQAACQSLAEQADKGRDRLLELASLRPETAEAIVSSVAAADTDEGLEEYFLRLLEHFHIYAQEIDDRTYLLNPDGQHSTEFPGLQDGETAATFDRTRALLREDLGFMTADHPLPGDAMELLLASGDGNAAFAVEEGDGPPALELESVFVLEPVAPPSLHVDRFLPPLPIRVVCNQRREDVSEKPARFGGEKPAAGPADWIPNSGAALRNILDKLYARSEKIAAARAEDARAEAAEAAKSLLEGELERLESLAERNDNVREEELEALEAEAADVLEAIAGARLRCDALRLVWAGLLRGGYPDP